MSDRELRAQAGEPEVVAWIDEFGIVYPKAAKRGPSLVNEHQRNWKEVITLQSHREAMARQKEKYAICFAQLLDAWEAIAEKDARIAELEQAVRELVFRPGATTGDTSAQAKDAL